MAAKSTEKIELVETQNLVLALHRLHSCAGGFNNARWRRALYQALAMSYCADSEVLGKIREALALP